MKSWLDGCIQRVAVNGSMSRWRLVTSGVPQRSELGPVLFNIFASGIDSGIDCTLSKLGGAVDTPEGRDAIQRDLDKLERWALVKLMRFNKAKCKVLHLGQGNPWCQYRLGDEGVESSPAEKDLGVLGEEKLNITQQCVPTWQSPGLRPQQCGHRVREEILPLCPALLRPPPGVLRPALEPSAQDRAGAVGVGPEEAPAVIRGLEPLCWEERLGELELLSLGKRRLQGDLTAAAST